MNWISRSRGWKRVVLAGLAALVLVDLGLGILLWQLRQTDPTDLSRQRTELQIKAKLLKADVARVGAGEQAVCEHECAERQRCLGRRQVQRGQRDQVPQRAHRLRALVVAVEPRSERHPVERLVAEVQAGERERREGSARPLTQGQVGVARQRAGQVQRRGERPTPQHRPPGTGLQHRDLKPRLDRHAM